MQREPVRYEQSNTVLLHLTSGIGNIVLATPLLLALSRRGHTIDLLVEGDYGETASLFQGWSALRTVFDRMTGECRDRCYDVVIPAIPPFYWARYAARYRGVVNCMARPADTLFYRDEQAFYLEFGRALGCDLAEPPYYFVPAAPDNQHSVTGETLVLAPGCKTGEMAAKRWPHFSGLAEMFEDVVVVGTPGDLHQFDGMAMTFPGHARSLVGRLSLREAAGVLAAAGAVVANDSGLGHIAGAVGTPTILLFGPTSDVALGRFPPNVKVLRTGLACEPCWFAERFAACAGRIACLSRITPDSVAAAIATMQNRVSGRGSR